MIKCPNPECDTPFISDYDHFRSKVVQAKIKHTVIVVKCKSCGHEMEVQ